MPNWCFNTVEIDAPEDVKKQIIGLIINDNEQVDFGLINPHPEPIKGILNFNETLDALVVNKSYENRLGELNTKDFIQALKDKKQQIPQGSLDPKHLQPGKDLSALISGIDSSEETAELSLEDVRLIDRLEQTLLSASCHTPNMAVEVILEAIINETLSAKYQPPLSKVINPWLLSLTQDVLPEEIIFAINELTEDIEAYCLKTHGVKNAYFWQLRAWGTKWNGGDVIFTDNGFSFDTAWTPPESWFYALAESIKDAGLQDYHITLTYVEPSNWVGGTLYNNNGDCYETEMEEDEIREMFYTDDEEDEGSENQ